MKKQEFKILVIEEQASIRNQFLSGLQAENFTAMGAENGQIGLQYIQEYSPDLITCGISLSAGFDGFAVLERLRQNSATAIIPFIFVTFKMTRADLHKAMELGASGYLIKPCTIDELVGTITAQLERLSLLHQHYSATEKLLANIRPVSQPANLTVLDSASQPCAAPLDKVFHFIAENYHRPIALSDVAQAVGYSPAYLTHLMGKQTGQTVQQWIIKHRMGAACSLLLETDEPVEYIAGQVGYRNPVHFFRQFRRLYGTTPQAWRKDHSDWTTKELL